jgi:hypothetical protein
MGPFETRRSAELAHRTTMHVGGQLDELTLNDFLLLPQRSNTPYLEHEIGV